VVEKKKHKQFNAFFVMNTIPIPHSKEHNIWTLFGLCNFPLDRSKLLFFIVVISSLFEKIALTEK